MSKYQNGDTPSALIDELTEKVIEGGGEVKRRPGALSALQRIEKLCDPDSFQWIEPFVTHNVSDFGLDKKRFPSDGAITGSGKIEGRDVFVYASDWTVISGTWGTQHSKKVHEMFRLAQRVGAPVVMLMETAGMRLHELVHAMEEGARAGRAFTDLVGVVPTFMGIMGSCIGLPAVIGTASNFVYMLRGRGSLCFAGPQVVKEAIGEEISEEELGGAAVHCVKNGQVTDAFDDEEALLEHIRETLSFLPQNNCELPPVTAAEDPPDRLTVEIDELLPAKHSDVYDIRKIITTIIDDGYFFEIQSAFAKNAICGFARLAGHPVAVIANNPKHLSGAVDVKAAKKLVHFVEMIDCFHLPLISFVDVPGVMPGSVETARGAIGHASRLAGTLMRLDTPKITLIVNRCFGGTWTLANSKATGGDLLYIYPKGLVGPMSPEALGKVVFKAEPPPEVVAQIAANYCSAFVAAKNGHVHDVLRPENTRRVLCRAIKLLGSKRTLGEPPRRLFPLPL